MADNVVLNPGVGGATIAADDIGGVEYQRVKLSLGADGVANDAPIGGGTEAGVLRVTVASNSTGVLAVTDNGGSLTVDGTVAATQSGTWNVGTVTTVNTVSSVTNVAALGTITPGTGATNLGKAEDAPHTSGDVGVMVLGVQKNADGPLAADLDYVPPQFDANGYLKVNIKAGAAAGGTSITDASAFTRGAGTETPVGFLVESVAPTLSNGQVSAPSMTTAGALRVNVASGGVQGVTEDVASVGSEEGILAMGVRQDTISATTSLDGDYCYPKYTSVGRLYTASAPLAVTTGGMTYNSLVAPATPAKNVLTSTVSQIYSITCFNLLATPVYLKIWDNVTGSVTLGVTACNYQYMIPGNTAGAGFSVPLPMGVSFTTGIITAVTGAIATTDNTSTTANSIIVNIGYK